MIEIVAIVEGQTEQAFVGDQLAGHLGALGMAIWAVLPGRSRRHGGVKQWASALGDILRTLREGRYCTTMFDYYALPNDWPGRAESKGLHWAERATHVEQAILADVTNEMGDSFNPTQFIPYIQLHEFEALLFTDVAKLAETLAPLSVACPVPLDVRLQEILDHAGRPEAINDGYETCPSRRIATLVPAFKKPLHGPMVTKRITLDVLRDRCDHFAQWLTRLERIGEPN